MGACNERSCLGWVMGEYSQNSVHLSSSISPFLSPFLSRNPSSSSYALPCIPRGLWLCPPPNFLFCALSVISPLPPSSAMRPPPLSPHSPSSPCVPLLPWLTHVFCPFFFLELPHQVDSPKLSFPLCSFLPLSPSAPLGTNPGSLDHSEVGRGRQRAHTCTAHFSNSPTHNCVVVFGDFVWPVFHSLWQGICLCAHASLQKRWRKKCVK